MCPGVPAAAVRAGTEDALGTVHQYALCIHVQLPCHCDWLFSEFSPARGHVDSDPVRFSVLFYGGLEFHFLRSRKTF